MVRVRERRMNVSHIGGEATNNESERTDEEKKMFYPIPEHLKG